MTFEVDFWSINKGSLSSAVQPKSYRLWIPLTGPAAAAFTTELQAALAGPLPVTKKRKLDETHGHPLEHLIKTRDDFASMIRIYYGARTQIASVAMEDTADDGSSRSDTHILTLLDAKRYLSTPTVVEKHQRQRLDETQRYLDHYVHYGDGAAPSFFPADKVRDGMLVRQINVGSGGMIKSAMDLLSFMLPHYIPPQRLVLNKLRVVLDSIGEPWNPSYDSMSVEQLIKLTSSESESTRACFTDPIDYSPIEVSDQEQPGNIDTTRSAVMAQLEQAYPVAFRLKSNNLARLEGARRVSPEEVQRVFEFIVHETRTLLTAHVDGVPLVYHDLLKESTDSLLVLQNDQGPAARMFFQKSGPPANYTGFGYRLLRLLMGSANCLRLMEQQSMLFLLLYARHFSVTANRAGVGGGLTLVCGPPDTGKSRACEQFLSSVAKPLHIQNDGQSEKAYTSNDKSTDLRCMFQDEVKDLLVGGNATDAASSANIKVQQTLLSRGYVRYKRLIQNTTSGEYEAQDILIVQRVMLLGCTNAVSSIPPAIQSRSCIVPVVRQPKDVARKVSVNALVASRDNPAACALETAFMTSTQLLSALQGRFWQLEAFGAIPGGIDTNVYTVFMSILEKDHGRDLMPARRYLDIKQTAEGLLVLDLVSLWYCRGLGATFGFDPAMEAMFYSARAVLRMEHVCAAFWMQISATSMNAHTTSVAQVIKELIKLDAGFPVRDDTGDFFVLMSTKRSIAQDVSARLPHMGVGLVQQVINQITKGMTRGLPNMRSSASTTLTDTMLVNTHFIASILTPIERKILSILDTIHTRPEVCQISYDENFWVFSSSIRQQIYPSGKKAPHPQLKDVPPTQLEKALTYALVSSHSVPLSLYLCTNHPVPFLPACYVLELLMMEKTCGILLKHIR